MNDTLAIILAGGKGSRLDPLTRDRAKPAVPFGGSYRIIDFTLSNCLNSGIRRTLVLTQYKAMSLDRHINLGWRHYFCRELGEFIDVLPPQQRIDEQWYQGTADAVYQNIYTLEKVRPRYVVVLAGDHVYKMNYHAMVDYHRQVGAELTIGALRVPVKDASQFGVMQVNEHDRIIGFQEKPQDPRTIPGDDKNCLASMGIYVFNSKFLFEHLCKDATDRTSSHDFGKDIIPSIIDSHQVFAFPFVDENRKKDAYWRDVGTLDAYYQANMDLIDVDPLLDVYDDKWPIRTFQPNSPPAKFVFASRTMEHEVSRASDSVTCQGVIVSGGIVEKSILSPHVRVNNCARVEESILFDGVIVGENAQIRRAIIDKGVNIPANAKIGFDIELDRERGFTISDEGIVVIAKGDGTEQLLLDSAMAG